MTSSSRATYLPRWSDQLTEQLLSYKSTTPSPPPPSQVPSSSRKPKNDSGTASVSLDMPNTEKQKQKGTTYLQQQQQQQLNDPFTMTTSINHKEDHQGDIPQFWSKLSQQLPSSNDDNNNKKKKLSSTLGIPSSTVEPKSPPIWRHEEDAQEDEDDDQDDNNGSLGMYLFWFGFLCPLLWWIGSFWPRHADRQGKMAHRWQLINRIMSISFCLLLILLLMAFGIWYRFAA
ncbi:hypothetical protein BC941DRAFT_419081 [Chlamydoabsidia padenii]|nr:hypothetical protein BC941DRAFT_419081 [Chlamydoabsidia padenii]